MLTQSNARRAVAATSAAIPADPGDALHLATRDPAMKRVEQEALMVAESEETVLLLGETGVGKDLLARRIHRASPRASGRFVSINCAALPEGLLETELFGHVRGAFTGAVESQPGQFEMASGGTIFLDEIGELSPRLQAKLLHVLQEKRFFRVGGRQAVVADARVIAATNQDLDRAMAEGRFRKDLYYRLSVVHLRIPALRDRPHDIEDLAAFFARRYAAVFMRPEMSCPPPELIAMLRAHPFEGNIRELENLIKRSVLLADYEAGGAELRRIRAAAARGPSHPGLAASHPAEPPLFDSEPAPLRDVARRAVARAESHALRAALDSTGWNRRRAARLLKISYRSMLYKIRDYSLSPAGSAPSDAASVIGPREGSC